MSEAALEAGIPRGVVKPPAAPAWLRAFSAPRPAVAPEQPRFRREFEPEPEDLSIRSRAAEPSPEDAAIDRDSEAEIAFDRFFAQPRRPEPVRKENPKITTPPAEPSAAGRRTESAAAPIIQPATESGPAPAAPPKAAKPMPAALPAKAPAPTPATPQPRPTVIARPVPPRVSVHVFRHPETVTAASSPAATVPASEIRTRPAVVEAASGLPPAPSPAPSIPAAPTRAGAPPAYPEPVVERMSTSTSPASDPAASFQSRERQIRVESEWPAPRPRPEAAGATGRKLHIGNLHITVERPAPPPPQPQSAPDPDRPAPFPEPYAKRAFNPWLRRDLDGY